MKRMGLFGASGCGRGVMPLVRAQCAVGQEPYELNFIDDNPASLQINCTNVLTYAEWRAKPASSRHINVAIADPLTRRAVVERCEADGLSFYEIRASNVVQMDDVRLGEGAILCPFVTLTSNIRIGRFFHANLYSYVEHDCVIGDFVTFAPGVKCNGNVVIGDHAYIGAGAVIRQGKHGKPLVIGEGAVVGMGAVVLNDVPAGATVVGNPARLIRK